MPQTREDISFFITIWSLRDDSGLVRNVDIVETILNRQTVHIGTTFYKYLPLYLYNLSPFRRV